jgi:lysozyme family protein
LILAAQSNVPWYVIAVIHNMDQAR